MRHKGLFLDRDGTIIVHREYLHRPDEVELLPGVRETLCRALADGYRLFLFTNQSGVGRGWFTMDDVEACQQRMLGLLQLPRPGFSTVCIAPEAPDQPVVYRKPSPRFILEMIARHRLDPTATWMVGDSLSDVHAGLNAGIRAALVNQAAPPDLPPEVWRGGDFPAFYESLGHPSAPPPARPS